MSNDELRDLLERVEAHGGPVSLTEGRGDSLCRIFTDEDVWWLNNVKHTQKHDDHLVGVLKRDLIERGLTLLIHARPSKWWVELDRGLDPVANGSGATELEAVLNGWLGAAKTEGWEA